MPAKKQATKTPQKKITKKAPVKTKGTKKSPAPAETFAEDLYIVGIGASAGPLTIL